MALSTNKKNKIISEWKAGMHKSYYAVSKAHKITQKTAKKIIVNADMIVKEFKAIKARDKMGTIYVIRAGDTNNYKIGITTGDMQKRLSSIQTGNHLKLSLINSVRCSNINTKEKMLHKKFNDYRSIREWFIIDDLTELLNELSNFRNNTVVKQDG